MSDDLDGFDSENEVDEEVHSNLISSVSQLEGKHRVKASVRKEPSIEVSEFHLVKSGTGIRDTVYLRQLAATLGKRGSHSDIKEKIRATINRKTKTLPKPLERVEANRIDRSVRYQNAQRELGRWNAVVVANRALDTISFPLNHETIQFEKSNEFVKKFKAETDLEIEMEKAVNGGVVAEEVTVMETSEFPMTLAELVQRRKELAKLRAQQAYREQKACRQNKIKSKKYHRILRKEKMKQQLKDFEVLKNTNPELALQQLEDLDKHRAEERASLRHRSTGRWAKSKAIRAKYDTESRKVLAQQLSISKDLTQKVRKEESSDDDDVDEPVQAINAGNNPWVNPWTSGPVTAGEEVSQFFSGYQKYQEKQSIVKAAAAEGEKEPQLTNGNSNGSRGVEDEAIPEIAAEAIESRTETTTASQISPVGKKKSQKKPKKAENQQLKDDFLQESPSHTEKVAATKTKHKSSPLGDVKAVSKKLKVWPLEENGRSKRGEQEGDAEAAVTSKRKQRPLVVQTVAAASGSWSVVAEETPPSRNKKQRPDADIDDLFHDIDDKFKKKLTARMSKLKAKLQIDDGNFVVSDRVADPGEEEEGGSLALKPQRRRPEEDVALNEDRRYRAAADAGPRVASLVDLPGGGGSVISVGSGGGDIDPTKFMSIKPKHLLTKLPDVTVAGEDAIDDDVERHLTITEAFADDNVVADFAKEQDEEEKSKRPVFTPKLPGWGDWVSDSKKVLKKRRRKPAGAKKPVGKVFRPVIINNPLDPKMQAHMVDTLPFPFTSVKAFEASIRAPLGNTWVTETAHRKLTAPRVITKLGTIIKPMDESSLVKEMDLDIAPRKK